MALPSEGISRVFISYAHKDGAELAVRLQSDLAAKGFDAWLDSHRLHGGASWSREIEEALDGAECVLALLSGGSYVSEICRAEQLRALRKGKSVIPVLAQRGSDVPLHLEMKQYRDFSAPAAYSSSFSRLLEDISADNGVSLRNEFRTTYVTAPPLPVNFVERPEALDALRRALITDDSGRHIALTALQGMGGIGKTVLAQALCHDEVVQQAFPDGIVWVSIGKEPAFDTVTRMREVGKALGDDLSRYDNELGARNQYRNTIRHKAALIVVDDVWRSSDLEALRAESCPRSRLLFTTRDAGIVAAVGAREHVTQLLSEEQSREVIAQWSGVDRAQLPQPADDLIRECGRLPLALSMVGAMLRGKPPALWRHTCELLRKADLQRISAQFPDYPHPNLFRAIQVSVDALDATSRERYLDLAVLPEDMAAPLSILQCVWGVDEGEATETAERFVSFSLAQRRASDGSITLHDLQLDYARAQQSGDTKEAFELIREAIRLSSHAISVDPVQFPSQMLGRLLRFQEDPAIALFLEKAIEGTRTDWLRPLQSTLHPPGTSLRRTLTGHTRMVMAVALTPDGRLAVSASDDNTLKVWEVSSGRELHTLAGHMQWVRAVALSADGRLAVSASYDKTLKVWEVGSGRVLHTLAGHTRWVRAVALTPDGSLAVSASDDKTLKVWEVSSGRELHTLAGHTNVIMAVALTADGRLAVSASDDQTLKVWEVGSGRELHTLAGHTDVVRAVALTADGKLAVSASDDQTLKVWELSSGRELHTLAGHTNVVRAVALTTDGRLAISASYDGTLKVWDVSSGRALHVLAGHTRWVSAVALTADGRLAVSASDDKTLKVWEVGSGRELHTLAGHTDGVRALALTPDGSLAVSASTGRTLKVWQVGGGRELHPLGGHTGAVRALALTADGSLAVSASADRTLTVWEVGSGRVLHPLTGHTGGVSAVALAADGSLAVSASYDKTLKVWEAGSGRELHTLAGHTSTVSTVALAADGRLAVSASYDGTLKVWEAGVGRELHTLAGHTAKVRAVALTADGRLAVSASDDKTLKVWEVGSGREPHTLAGHTGRVSAVALTADGRLAVSGSYDGTLKVWEVGSGRVLHTLAGHTHWVTAVALTADGRLAVSASEDKTLRVWELGSGRELHTLAGHTHWVRAVALTADGRLTASASYDETLRVWEVESGNLVATFTADGTVNCCAFCSDHHLIAGDSGGRVHFLRIEKAKPQ